MIDEFIAAARECLGVPFRHQGRDPATGLDCAGLLCHAAEQVGLPYADVRGYGRTPAGGMLAETVAAQPCLRRVSRAPRPGDVLLMKFRTDPQHLALCTDVGILHAYEGVGRVVEHRLDDRWSARIVAVFEFVGAE